MTCFSMNSALVRESSKQLKRQNNKTKPASDETTSSSSSPTMALNDNDVLCARGKQSMNHLGNQRFRTLLKRMSAQYKAAKSKLEKSMIVSQIIDEIHSTNGRFLRKDDTSSEWVEVPSSVAREKVGQGFRDVLDTKYKSSTKAKQQRRNIQNSQRTIFTNAQPETPASVVVAMSEEDARIENSFFQANMELLKQIKLQEQRHAEEPCPRSLVSSSPLMTALLVQHSN